MIIIEGPDGAGKTTLIEILQKSFNLSVAPRVVAKDTSAMADLVKWTEDNVKKRWHSVLYDRHRLISEPIYGTIMNRDAPQFDNTFWMRSMMAKFYLMRPTLIYCIPPKQVVHDNIMFDEQNDNFAVSDVWGSIYNAYVSRSAIDFSVAGAIIHDYTQPLSLGLIIDRVSKELYAHGK